MTLRRGAAWLGVVVVLELVARAIVYTLAPAPLASARSLTGQVGGPRFALVVLVALGLAALLGGGIVWLASIGVGERWALADERPLGPRPRVAIRALLARAGALTVAGWLAFAAVESAIHLRAGLGFHGLECLVGPVHRNALPVVAGVAIVAAALWAAAELLVAWMRRTVARFGRYPTRDRSGFDLSAPAPPRRSRRPAPVCGLSARGPPLLVA